MALGNIDYPTPLQNGSLQQLSPPLRTYIKVKKLGSLGRYVDVTRFKNYDDLRSSVAYMFGLYEILCPSGSSWTMHGDPSGSNWKLVYVDYDNDMLLVGDIPWEEFVSCVSCIRIVSPLEVKQFWAERLHIRSK